MNRIHLGFVYPIPLQDKTDDWKLDSCSNKNRIYPHSTNCSLFHLCHLNVYRTYSCMHGHFFNSETNQCQYLPTVRD